MTKSRGSIGVQDRFISSTKIISHNEPIITLGCAKAKVASLKWLTIPRLELTAATYSLINYIQQALELAEITIFMWTDSSVSLTWINSHPSRWNDFVRNQVAAIQEQVPQGQRRLVSGNGKSSRLCISSFLFSSTLSAPSLVERPLILGIVFSASANHGVSTGFGGDSRKTARSSSQVLNGEATLSLAASLSTLFTHLAFSDHCTLPTVLRYTQKIPQSFLATPSHL